MIQSSQEHSKDRLYMLFPASINSRSIGVNDRKTESIDDFPIERCLKLHKKDSLLVTDSMMHLKMGQGFTCANMKLANWLKLWTRL